MTGQLECDKPLYGAFLSVKPTEREPWQQNLRRDPTAGIQYVFEYMWDPTAGIQHVFEYMCIYIYRHTHTLNPKPKSHIYILMKLTLILMTPMAALRTQASNANVFEGPSCLPIAWV